MKILFNIIGALALILLTVSGIIYTQKGFTLFVKNIFRVGLGLSVIYLIYLALILVGVLFSFLL